MQQEKQQLKHLIDQMSKSPVWQDDGLFKLYLYCLSRISKNTYLWHGILIQPGDMPFAERHVSEDLRWSRNKLDRKLKLLCDNDLIELRSLGYRGTLLHANEDKTEYVIFGSLMEKVWLQIKAFDGSALKPDAFQSEANNGSGSQPSFFQSDAIDGFEMIRMWPQVEAKTPVNGFRTEPDNIKKNTSSSIQEPDGFTRLWVAYPSIRRTARAEAAELVQKALNDGATIDILLEALEADKQSDNWHQENGRFIPGIVKWLQKEEWRNYIEPKAPEEDDEAWTTW